MKDHVRGSTYARQAWPTKPSMFLKKKKLILTKIENSIAKEPKIQPTWVNPLDLVWQAWKLGSYNMASIFSMF